MITTTEANANNQNEGDLDECPLLSIVVPTKDRYPHLIKLINYLEVFAEGKIELVIQDNTDDNFLMLDFLRTKERSYINYNHSKEPLPISVNVDLAVRQSTGQYICFIGDDDGVMPSILECVKWMKANDVDAATFANIIYNWPDYYADENKNDISGTLQYEDFSFEVSYPEPIEQLKIISRTGFTTLNGLPKLYQGIVSRTLVNQLYAIGKTYTPGPSPDIATAVALAFICKRFAMLRIPAIITGQSANVGGGERKLRGRAKDLQDVKFISEVAKLNWSPLIPKMWCTQTVWPESALKAMQYMGEEDSVKISYSHIYARIAQNYPYEFFNVYKFAKNKSLFIFLYCYYTSGRMVKSAINYFESKLKGKSYGNWLNNEVNDLSTLEMAAHFIESKHRKFCCAGCLVNLKAK